MFQNNDIGEFAARPDREALRADLATFFGPSSAYYLYGAERALEAAREGRRFVLFWSWPVFWSWFVWFAWRKCYPEACGALALVMAADALDWSWPEGFGALSTIAYLAICLWAKPAYLRHAFRAIRRVDAQGLVGEGRRDALARAGGVSPTSAAAGLGALVATCVAWAIWRLPDIIDQTGAWGLLPPQ